MIKRALILFQTPSGFGNKIFAGRSISSVRRIVSMIDLFGTYYYRNSKFKIWHRFADFVQRNYIIVRGLLSATALDFMLMLNCMIEHGV